MAYSPQTLVLGLGASTGMALIKDLDELHKLEIPGTMWLVLAALTDTMISLPLVWYLVSDAIPACR